MEKRATDKFEVGDRVKLVRDCERLGGAIVEAGALGTVTTNDDIVFGVTLDAPPDWLEEWAGELQWCDVDECSEIPLDVEKL